MDLRLTFAAAVPSDTPLVAVFVEDPTAPSAALDGLPASLATTAKRELELGRIRPCKGDTAGLTAGDGADARGVLVGLGSQDSGRTEAVRVAGGAVASAARALRVTDVTVVVSGLAPADAAALVEGVTLAMYRFDIYKTGTDVTERPEPTLTVVGADDAAQAAVSRAHTVASAANWARDLANAPGNLMTPAILAEQAQSLAAQHPSLKFHALGRDAIEAAGMGLIAGVAQGSVNEPRVIVLEWDPEGVATPDDERIALVGKAVTFDTGGISIKPSAGMQDMKMDMGGGAAVLGAVRAIAELGLKTRVLAVVGSAENMPGGNAYKPGDVLTAKDGTTVEITNTDAEGRLVLGDAITYAKELGCGRIVEASTLTGAMVVALGDYFAGLVADEGADWTADVLAASKTSGDHAWHLPMHDAYKPALRSDLADMVNSGPRPAGSLYAGLFVKHFAKDTPFAHLDIAGTGMLSKPRGYYTVKGASGYGVRLFTELVSASAG